MNLLRLIRVQNLGIIVLTQVIIYQVLNPYYCLNRPFENGFLLLVLATVLLSAAGYIINDYFDVKIDAINKPERLIVTRYLQPRIALFLHFFCNLSALAIGFYLSWHLFLVFLLVAFMLWQYSASWKKKPVLGNLTVAFLLSLTLYIVGVWDDELHFPTLLFYMFFAFFTGLLREIIKDMEDVKGDSRHGCRTIPIEYGMLAARKTSFVLASFAGAVIGAFTFLFYLYEFQLYAYYLVILVIIPWMLLLHWIRLADRKSDFSRLSLLIKLIMITGVLSLLLLCYYL